MIFRKSTIEDLDAVTEIAADAKALLRIRGISQWQKGTYPDSQTFSDDVSSGIGYVISEGSDVLAVCAVTFTVEKSYLHLLSGSWLTDDNSVYATIHRSAVAKQHHGKHISTFLFDSVLDLAKQEGAKSIRVDTHPDNMAMQGALSKCGFIKCCEFYLADGDEAGDLRYGYERIIL